jgi:hypothetical protein
MNAYSAEEVIERLNITFDALTGLMDYCEANVTSVPGNCARSTLCCMSDFTTCSG